MIPVLNFAARLGGAWRARLRIIGLLGMFTPQLMGQVFQVNGGASSLYQAEGGTLSVRGPSYKASLGGNSGGAVCGRSQLNQGGGPNDLDRGR